MESVDSIRYFYIYSYFGNRYGLNVRDIIMNAIFSRRCSCLSAILHLSIVGILISEVAATEGRQPEKKPAPGAIRQLVFSEQFIKGKVRRPQLVLIKAEQRPAFTPMAMQAIGGQTNFISDNIEQYTPYSKPFVLEGNRVVNCVP
jgi:hypothetical protein